MRKLLREIVGRDGRRGFPKSGDGLMQAILGKMVQSGELVQVGETEEEVIYGLPDPPEEADLQGT